MIGSYQRSLPYAAWGLGDAVSPLVGPGQSPGGSPGSEVQGRS